MGYDVCEFLTYKKEFSRYYFHFYTNITPQSSFMSSKIFFSPRYPCDSSLNSDLRSIYFLLMYRLHCEREELIISVT